jgi:hypothetical protein
MPGDKSSPRLVRFWWVIAAMAGATAGATVVAFYGLTVTVWGVAGAGIPIAALVAYIELSGASRQSRPVAGGRFDDKTQPFKPSRSRYDYKAPGPRGQLRAITRRKTEPPSSTSP